jgi:hypothetical protein
MYKMNHSPISVSYKKEGATMANGKATKKVTLKIPVHADNLASLGEMSAKLGLELEKFVGILVNSFAIASASLTGEPVSPIVKPVVEKKVRTPRVKKTVEPAPEGWVPPIPKKRGRPKKIVDVSAIVPAEPKKRGRPKKVVAVESTEGVVAIVKKPRAARKPKTTVAVKAVKAPKAEKIAKAVKAPKAVKTPKAEKAPKAAKAPKAEKIAKAVKTPKTVKTPKAAKIPKAAKKPAKKAAKPQAAVEAPPVE